MSVLYTLAVPDRWGLSLRVVQQGQEVEPITGQNSGAVWNPISPEDVWPIMTSENPGAPAGLNND